MAVPPVNGPDTLYPQSDSGASREAAREQFQANFYPTSTFLMFGLRHRLHPVNLESLARVDGSRAGSSGKLRPANDKTRYERDLKCDFVI